MAQRSFACGGVWLLWWAGALDVYAQAFEAASVKANRSGIFESSLERSGGRLHLENVPLRECIQVAYGIPDQVYALQGPKWLKTDRYDVAARMAPDTPKQEMLRMLRALLEERFRLKLHRESRELRVLALVGGRNGPALRRAASAEGDFTQRAGHVAAKGLSMDEFANRLAGPVFQLGAPVVNATELAGTFDFTLDWRTDEAQGDEAGKASLFTAIEEQLGLQLERSRRRVEVWVVDHAERTPIEN
jgi:uncharacterized protein (TIGR03435 family)